MRRPLMTLVLGSMLAVATGCSGSGASSTPGSATSPALTGSASAVTSSTATGSLSAEAAGIDRQFIDMMVPHHESAVEMAKLAQERAEHTELKSLAAGIIAVQQREIAQLTGWRQAWFGSPDTPPMSAMPLMPGMGAMPGHDMADAPTMDMTRDVEALKTAAEFDRAFVDSMIAHHRSAIEAAGIALARSKQSDVRALATAIIEAQQAEITQLERWRAEWFPG